MYCTLQLQIRQPKSNDVLEQSVTATLYIVATPIGNLGDISQRAIDTLKQVDLVAAEDTRHSRPLLQQFGITTSLCAYHEHNEQEQTSKLIEKLQAGESIALISDAGTPLINDPGYKLVAAAHDQQIPVVPIPGASAVIAALSASGLATVRFTYEGYLPAKSEARKKCLAEQLHEARTMVFYETPHRIQDAIKDIQTVFGDERRITVARELTKQYEQIVRDSISNIAKQLNDETIKAKGEFVIIIEGAEAVAVDDAEALRIQSILAETMSTKDAAALTARITGRKKNEIYKLAVNSET